MNLDVQWEKWYKFAKANNVALSESEVTTNIIATKD